MSKNVKSKSEKYQWLDRQKDRKRKELIIQTPIKTIEQAKIYFRLAECSHDGMARNSLQRHDEYRQLNISKQLEMEWIKERFDECHKSILENTEDDLFSDIFNGMYNLFAKLKSENELKIMLDVAHFIRDKMRLKDRIIVASTINGRTVREARTGLIYLAYDMKNIVAAKEFANLSLYFSAYIEGKTSKLDYCEKQTNLCKEIMQELGL